MTATPVMRDERTRAIENASYRWAYLVLSYGLLLSTAYRSFARGEASWDLLGLVILGGAVANVYQANQRVLNRRWAVSSIVAMVVAVVIGAAIVLLRR